MVLQKRLKANAINLAEMLSGSRSLATEKTARKSRASPAPTRFKLMALVEGIFRKYRTGGNDIVVFWGDFGEDNLTIKRLENRALPVAVDLLDPELCVPSDYMKTKYQARWSVLEACEVVVL